ncbi:peptidoglycan-binding protein [Candidatus Pacearchaeota archaeon]|nr:peptidoglycan-binding protein [Candidatus Pacearchaeota archaeon]
MERKLLAILTEKMKVLDLPEPVDVRRSLPVNPRGRKFKKRLVHKLGGLVWHQELGWHSIEAVAKYHTGPKSHVVAGGTESILYTLAIDESGKVHLCNDLNKSTWSHGDRDRAGDENSEFMSVMFVGDFKAKGHLSPKAGEPSRQQMLAGMILWEVCRELWGWNDSQLYGHFDFGKDACPGDTLRAMIEAIRANEKLLVDLETASGKQLALKALGCYFGKVDGIWGGGSIKALKVFQGANGLVADGVWGMKTEAMIKRKLAEVR